MQRLCFSSPWQGCRAIHTINATFSSFKENELKLLGEAKNPIRFYLPASSRSSDERPFLDKRLLVVMVGWAESKQTALSKYAAIYTHLGLPCVSMASSISLLWYTRLGNRATKNLLNLLDCSLEQPTSLLYHIFSGGGMVVFPQLISEHNNPSSLLSSKLIPAGVVFDSGPADFTRKAGLAASKLVYQQGGYNFLTYSLANTVGILTDIAIGSRKRLENKAALEHQQLLQLPQLYLYSLKDSVHPHEQALKIMEEQRYMGREVGSYCWEDLDHVRHFMKHPKEYTEIIDKFVTALKT